MRLKEFALISPLVFPKGWWGEVLSPLGPIPDGDISSSSPLPVYTDDTS